MTEILMLAKDEEFLLALKSGPKKRGRLTSLLGLSGSAFQRTSEKLIRYGLVGKSKYGFYSLTDKGKNYVEDLSLSMRPTFKDKKVQALIDMLPTESHRALFRLLLSGIVAKKYLFEEFNDNWPGFIIGGRTKTFKTALAKVICYVLGLDPAKYIYSLHTATAGEFGVRRRRVKGEEMFDISSSPYFTYPFVCLDELDKISDRAIKRNVMHFLDGRREFTVEAKQITNRACVLVTLNSKLSELEISEEYIRRCVVVNTDPLVYELKDVDLIAKEIFGNPISRIKIDNLKVNFTHLQKEEFRLMRDLLHQGTREERRHLIDSKPLEILILGRLILSGRLDIQEAIFEAVYDRLTCLETLQATVEDWREPLTEEWIKYRGKRDPELEKKRIEVEEKRRQRQIRLEERQKEIKEKEVEVLDQRFDFDMEYSRELAKFREIIAALKNLPGGKWKYKTKPIRDSLTREYEYFDRGKRTTEKLEKLKRILPERQKLAEPYLKGYREEQEQIKREYRQKQGQIERKKEEKESIIKEFRTLNTGLYALTGEDSEGRLWRSRTKKLRSNIGGVIQQRKKLSLRHLRSLLNEARDKANPMFEEYRQQKEIKEAISSIRVDPLGALVKAAKWFFTPPKKMDHPGPEIKEKKNVLEEEEDGFWWRPKF